MIDVTTVTALLGGSVADFIMCYFGASSRNRRQAKEASHNVVRTSGGTCLVEGDRSCHTFGPFEDQASSVRA
jgi:hypothetical protein